MSGLVICTVSVLGLCETIGAIETKGLVKLLSLGIKAWRALLHEKASQQDRHLSRLHNLRKQAGD